MANGKQNGESQFKKKGGTVFPRISLEEAISYAQKLVPKTFSGAQPATIIFPGVFGAKGNRGEIRASAMKQYGLMAGTTTAYTATPLAKDLQVAAGASRSRSLRDACLRPKVFRVLFDTFHGDTVSVAELKRQAQSTNVHPDLLDDCVDVFCASVQYAGLGTREGDQVRFVSAAEAEPLSSDTLEDEELPDAGAGAEGRQTKQSEAIGQSDREQPRLAGVSAADGAPSARAIIHVNVNLDSSLDTEKLEKQLGLLRRYGAI